MLILVLFAGVVLLVPAVWGAWDKERETLANRAIAEQQLAQQTERKDSLEKEVIALRTDRGVEEELRHRFAVGDEGEGVIYIVDREVAPAGATGKDQGGILGWLRSLWPF